MTHFYMGGGLNIASVVRVPKINAIVTFYGIQIIDHQMRFLS